MSEVKNYSPDLQQLFVQFMFSDPELYSRVRSIIKPEYFDRSVRPVVKQLIAHSDEYSSIPSLEMVKAETGVTVEKLDNNDQHIEWFVDEFETFSLQSYFTLYSSLPIES